MRILRGADRCLDLHRVRDTRHKGELVRMERVSERKVARWITAGDRTLIPYAASL